MMSFGNGSRIPIRWNGTTMQHRLATATALQAGLKRATIRRTALLNILNTLDVPVLMDLGDDSLIEFIAHCLACRVQAPRVSACSSYNRKERSVLPSMSTSYQT